MQAESVQLVIMLSAHPGLFENHSTVPFRETVVKVAALAVAAVAGYTSVRMSVASDSKFELA